MAREKKLSINDVARLAGTSKRTVSRVINNDPKVSAKTLAKVQSVIEQYNYSPSPQARALSLRRSFLVSIVHDNPNASYVTEAMYGALEICRSAGYELIMHPCDLSRSNAIDEIMRFIEHLKIEGVILLQPASEFEELATRLKEIRCNYVCLLSARTEDDAHMIYHNDGKAVRQIVDHIVDLGHRDIAIIRGPENSQAANQRFEAFRTALARHDFELQKNHVAVGDHTFQSGIEGAEWLLNSNRLPTAIFASNDEMAIGAIVTAQKMGIRIPKELTVVGFDNSPQALKMWPALTTAELNVRQMTELAARKLLAQCSGDRDTAAAIPVEVEPTFIQRQTTDVPATVPIRR